MRLTLIISGGQTGADRGALDAAAALGIPTGGWCPKGWRTDAGTDPSLATFHLQETQLSDYRTRTLLNVRKADATVWFGTVTSPGGKLTKRTAWNLKKRWLENPTPAALRRWLDTEAIQVLNVAGNREQKKPGIRGEVYTILLEALS